jgi:glycosyltransferase involved in cell wall biosynthesis
MGLRVCNIIEDGRFGGAQARIIAVADRLRNKGIETIVVLPKDDSGVFQLMLSQKKLQTIPIRLHRSSRNIPQLIRHFFYFIPELICLIRILKREKVDIVHCNGSWQIKGVIGGKLTGKKVLWHLNDTRRIRIIDLFSYLAGKYLCDAFIFAAKRVRDYYLSNKSIARKPHFEIQAPVDTEVFDPDRVKPEKGLERNGYYSVVTIGNVNPAKGIEYFVEMVSLLNEKFENLWFCIVGPHFLEQGKYSRKLNIMIKKGGFKNIFFRGWVKDVRPILKAANIYVCSSVHEASPTSVWEAMAMGKPIVATDVGDVARFIMDGENGFVVPPRNSEALAEKVEILLRDEKRRRKFSERVRNLAVEHLDIDVCVKKHAQAYRYVLGMKA